MEDPSRKELSKLSLQVSDSSVVMRVEPGRACRGRGASLAGITAGEKDCPSLWALGPNVLSLISFEKDQHRQRCGKSPVGGVSSVHSEGKRA